MASWAGKWSVNQCSISLDEKVSPEVRIVEEDCGYMCPADGICSSSGLTLCVCTL